MKNSQALFLKVVAVAAVLGVFGRALAQTPDSSAPIGGQEQLVSLSMLVTDKGNHAVDDAQVSEWQVFENGKPQPIYSFTKEEKPVRYAIALDASLSFRTVFASAVAACGMIVNENKPGDEAALIRFVSSDKIKTLQDFTADKTEIADALKRLYLEGGQTALIDAAYYAVESATNYKAGDLQVRRAVVLISDGEDRRSANNLDALIRLLHQTNVQIFVIGMVSELEKEASFSKPSSQAKAVELLNRLARETGGRVLFARDASEVQTAAREISHDLHVQYTIAYRAPQDHTKGFHKVEIKPVGKRKLKAVTRPGYFAN